MSESTFRTTLLNNWMQRIHAGDRVAKDELIRSVCERLERLARKMLQGFPTVQRYEDTGDVLQNALVRLSRSLEAVAPATTREFFGLATEQIRRELIDLARHYQGKHGLAANQVEWKADDSERKNDPVAASIPLEEIERWSRFHAEVERLPVEERETVGLIYYHGWKQNEVAEFLHVDLRTVQRRWLRALGKLHALLKDGDESAVV